MLVSWQAPWSACCSRWGAERMTRPGRCRSPDSSVSSGGSSGSGTGGKSCRRHVRVQRRGNGRRGAAAACGASSDAGLDASADAAVFDASTPRTPAPSRAPRTRGFQSGMTSRTAPVTCLGALPSCSDLLAGASFDATMRARRARSPGTDEISWQGSGTAITARPTTVDRTRLITTPVPAVVQGKHADVPLPYPRRRRPCSAASRRVSSSSATCAATAETPVKPSTSRSSRRTPAPCTRRSLATTNT